MSDERVAPMHPGEVLLEEFLKPMGISQYRLGKDIGVPPRRINEIVHGKRIVTADTALRLARYILHFRPVLVEPSGAARPRGGEGPTWGPVGQRSPSAGDVPEQVT